MDKGQKAPARPLWDRLEEIRATNGWTWLQLARAAGINRTTIGKWRTQPRSPLPPSVKRVAERLGIDVQEAMQLAGVVSDPDAPPDHTPQGEEEVPDGEDARDARARVMQAMERDPELAVVFAELLARVRGAPPPAERADVSHRDADVAYRDKEGGAA